MIFSISFGYTNKSTLHWKKSCPIFLQRVAETQIQQKPHSLNSSFPKIQLAFQSRLLAFRKWLKSLKQKNEQVDCSEKLVFPLLQFLSNSSKNSVSKKVPAMAYEVFRRNIHPLFRMFHFDLVWKLTEFNYWALIILQNSGNGVTERASVSDLLNKFLIANSEFWRVKFSTLQNLDNFSHFEKGNNVFHESK